MIAPSEPAPSNNEAAPAVSLEDAQKITSGIDAQIAAPPRTIADITAVLDREKPDPAKVAAARAVADKEVPDGLDAAAAANSYLERGAAAGELGRTSQRLSDLRKAVELIEPVRDRNLPLYDRITANFASSEDRSGNLREAIRLLERIEDFAASRPDGKGILLIEENSLIGSYIRLGNIAAAEGRLAKIETLMRDTKWGERLLKKLNLLRKSYDRAKAVYLDAQGKYGEAEGYYRRALLEVTAVIEESKSWDAPPPRGQYETQADFIQRDLGLNLLRQGRLVEAEIQVRHGLTNQLRMRGRYANESMELLVSLGAVVAAQGRNTEAEKLDKVAIDTYAALGHAADSYALNVARRDLAAALAAQGRWAEALAQFDVIRQAVAKDPDMLHVFLDGNLGYALAAIRGGRAEVALEASQRALADRIKSFGEKHYDTAEARGVHALALAVSGNRTVAATDFAAAVPTLLEASRQGGEEAENAGREIRLQQILEGYLSVLGDGRGGPDAVAEAFRVADGARGRSVQKALAASAARSAVADPALADLVRRDQDAERGIAGFNSLITNVLLLSSDQQDAATIASLRKEIEQLRSARATLRAEIGKRFPDYINLIDPKPATVAETQAVLEPGEALIATYVAEDRTYVWAVPKQGAVAFAPVALKRSELEVMVAQLRKAIEPNGSSLGDIAPFDIALAYKLYSLLLKSVEAGFKGATRLLVVSHGPLGQLPLALLVTRPAQLEPDKPGASLFTPYQKVPWLVRETAIAELPSVASLLALRGPRAGGRAAKPFIGFGDPWFSTQQAAEARAHPAGTQLVALATASAGKALATRGVPLHLRSVPKTESINEAMLGLLPRLPDTAEEVREVALALHADPEADVLLGARASESAVRTMKLDDRRVVMFATHGLVPGDLDGLSEPALALSAPEVSGDKGDGLLTMSKIIGLKLNADWVVLSACNTAAGNGAGAEAVSGLGLAFFYAGARSLVVSNWPVETTSARELTTAIFRKEAETPGLARAEALRQAMLALIDGPGYVDKTQNHALFSYAHPLFWAPFTLVGDGAAPRTR